jgi:thiamine-monophosphate kinase
MGGKPVAAFLSLALPGRLPQSWVDRFARGFLSFAEKYGVTLAGGDTAHSPNGILADIVVIGTVPKGRAVLRSQSRAGDLICVTGELGGSAAALARMLAKPNSRLKPTRYSRHFFPEPRIALGRFLREKRLPSAMIDTSDGLSTDLAHICEESGVGAEIHADRIPRATIGKPALRVDLQLALHGGEDYELLFTVPRTKKVPRRIAGVPITCIGQITRDPEMKILLIEAAGSRVRLKAKGWEHFRS